MNLTDKTALVTGATRGIGRQTAIMLGESGATVIGTATTEQGAELITRYLSELDIKGQGVVLDVTDTTAIVDVLGMVQHDYSAPDILVNNAGVTEDNLVMRMKNEQWDKVINTNLNAIFYMSRACLKSMVKQRWGRIINLSSVVGLSGNTGQANYAAAKAGLIGFTKSLAIEMGVRGITVNVVAPGFIETDMTDQLPETQKNRLLDQIPLRRIGQAAEVAAAIRFLASPDASYITGETLHVNGGMYMA